MDVTPTMIDFHSLHHCQACRMQEHLFVHGLSTSQKKELSTLGFRQTIGPGAWLFHEGDAPQGVHLLRKGHAKVSMTSAAGRTVILYLAAPGEMLGLSSAISGGAHQVSVAAAEPCDVETLRRDDFLGFLNRHADQFRAALDELSMQHTCVLAAIRRLALSPSLLAGIAGILLGLNCPQSGDATGIIHLRLTQQEMAQQLGATRESVARALSKLRKNGIIEQHAHKVILRNPALLEHLAGPQSEEAERKLA